MSKSAPSSSRRATTGGAPNDAPAPRHDAKYQPGRNRRREARLKSGRFEVSVRDKDAVIFGLGRNLPISRKIQLQRRLYYVFAGIIGLAIVAVLFAGWLSVNVIQPNQPIVTVNGAQVPQKMYRYMVAYMAQDRWNQLQAANAQQAQLQETLANTKDQTKITTLNAQLTAVQSTISSLQTSFSQTQVDSDAMDQLIWGQLIQQAIPGYLRTDPKGAAGLQLTTKQINDAYAAFAKAFPAGQSVSSFLSQDNMSKSNLLSAIEVKLRFNAMDQYQQSFYTSPTRQVDFARIEFNSKSKAQADLAKLRKDPTQWDAIVKVDSIDANSRTNNGDMGYAALGQQDQGLEGWFLDPSRKVGEISGLLVETGGTFDIVKIIAIDPARTLDSTTLASLKSNALNSHWLTGKRDLPPTKVIGPNTDMETSAANVPQTPNLNINFGTSSESGAPAP
jgi:hypothetical protein